MAHHSEQHYNLEQRFDFTAATKKSIMTVLVIGAILLGIGIILGITGGGHEEAGEAGGHAFHWYERLYANLWINNVFFYRNCDCRSFLFLPFNLQHRLVGRHPY